MQNRKNAPPWGHWIRPLSFPEVSERNMADVAYARWEKREGEYVSPRTCSHGGKGCPGDPPHRHALVEYRAGYTMWAGVAGERMVAMWLCREHGERFWSLHEILVSFPEHHPPMGPAVPA